MISVREQIPAQVLNVITGTVAPHRIVIKKVSILLLLDTHWKMSHLLQVTCEAVHKERRSLLWNQIAAI